jgi:hypothetical protein
MQDREIRHLVFLEEIRKYASCLTLGEEVLGIWQGHFYIIIEICRYRIGISILESVEQLDFIL